jgi:methylmalonyl-CoA mutase
VTHVADPLAGSYYVEKLTADLIDAARALMAEVDGLGGMTAAVASGMPKLRIEAAAARRQAAVDRGDEVIVGVNRYRLATEDDLDIRVVGDEVAAGQIAALRKVREMRDGPACDAALDALRQGAAVGHNLLALAVTAARARATVGEISAAMEDVFGRHAAEVRTLKGVYGAAWDGDEGFAAVQAEVAGYAGREGRRPRMLVVKMGQDGHDRGAKVIATGFADIGFDVDVGALFQTPDEAAQDAIDRGVDVVGISSLAAGHRALAPRLIAALRERGAGDIVVVCGGVIPAQDHAALIEAGVAAVFGPGTRIPDAAQHVLGLLRRSNFGPPLDRDEAG